MIRPLFLLALASVLLPLPLAAAEKAGADQATLLHLSEPARRMVPRDRLRAVLRVDAEDADAAKLQAAINQRLAAAVARAKGVAGVTVSTGGYAVYQERPQGQPPQWHGSASLALAATDAAPLLTLVGALQQDGLVIAALAYELTPEAARAAEDSLTAEALARLKQRARRVADDLGFGLGRIRDLHVGNATGEGPMPRVFAASSSFSSAAAVAPVAEPGEAEVTVTVTAEIELVAKR